MIIQHKSIFTIFVPYLLILISGCDFDAPHLREPCSFITDGPLKTGGRIEPGTYSCGVFVFQDGLSIIIDDATGSVTVDGETSLYFTEDGHYWFALDLASTPIGTLFTITINLREVHFEVYDD